MNGLLFSVSIAREERDKRKETPGRERRSAVTKIIYLDIDGTLRDERYGIPASAETAVQKCRREGIIIVICTGRNPGAIQQDVRCLETDGVISGGGCYIEFCGKLLKDEHFQIRILADFLEFIRKHRLGAALEAEQDIYMNARAAEFYQEDFDRKIQDESEARRCQEENKIRYKDNFSELWKERGKIHKICLLGSRNGIEQVQKQFEGDTETVQKKEWNGKWYIELLPKFCGKGYAIEFLNHYLGIRREESMSFGDGDNDIEMLKAVGTGIAVTGGSQRLLECADAVCELPLENGIYKELVRRGIIEPDEKKERRA